MSSFNINFVKINIKGLVIFKVLHSHRSKMSVKCKIIKTIRPPSYHHNNFVVDHALEHMMYGYTFLVPMNKKVFIKLNARVISDSCHRKC